MWKNVVWMGGAVIFCLQWIILRLSGLHLDPLLQATLSGLAIFGAAFMLSWAAELAQLDIPRSLALSFLALIAVLPEYAVDIYFAWTAGKNPHYTAYATANMTGANRLLIGLGWSSVVFAYWFATRKRNLTLDTTNRTEMSALLAATAYSFIIPLKGTISVIDAIFLLAIFGYYITKAAKTAIVEPEMEGPAEILARLPVIWRRGATIFLFLFSAYAIFIAAKPFAEGLLAVGRQFGIEEFILVQWLAPLASESPEFIVAILFALKANPAASIGTLISSKVNQWTLLVGMLPLAYNLSSGNLHPMILDNRQTEEILLTSAQSLFALILIANLTFSFREAAILMALFVTQLFFTNPHVRYMYSWAYIILGMAVLAFSPTTRRSVFLLFRITQKPFK